MQFLLISDNTNLQALTKFVGSRNVDSILSANQLSRTPNIGQELLDKMKQSSRGDNVSPQRKLTLLNRLTSDSDIYEHAALMSETSWRAYDKLGTFPSMLYVPESVSIPESVDTLGNSEPIAPEIYKKVSDSLKNNKTINPEVFNSYSTDKYGATSTDRLDSTNPFQWFKLPWGKITLHSSIDGETKEFPVYPEEISDNRTANYDTMPGLLYQYEPWQLYKDSGPRTIVYTFDMHRDMWTGDHRDGQCEDLIDFCMANCYPEITGAAVHVPICTMYINGKSHLRGIITEVSPKWDGPIGIDGWYLHCVLQISMTEVSATPLNYDSVRNSLKLDTREF